MSIRYPVEARKVADVLKDLATVGSVGSSKSTIPTGFDPLDSAMSGGLRPGELMLLGGNPGVGKTILALQWAREIATSRRKVVYACYEHDEPVLLARLLAMEIGMLPEAQETHRTEKLRAALLEVASGSGGGLIELVQEDPLMEAAYNRCASYSNDLFLAKAAGSRTGLEELRELATAAGEDPAVLFVDYLQKVAVLPEPPNEAEKVTRIVEGLKDMALAHNMAVVAVVASDREALSARRLRLHHLRGSSALAYEADVAILLNDKMSCVSKVHLAFDPVKAETYRDYVVFSIEKNRGGPNLQDLEFKKEFSYFKFHPVGGYVSERLIDERLYLE